MRRALAFVARVRGLDYCAAQGFRGQLEILNGTRTCLAGASCTSDKSMCVRVGCIAHVNYRNWNIIPECDA